MIKKIIKKDLKNLFTSPQAIIVVLALLTIPTFYSAVNIVAFWNPYNHVDQLQIGMVDYDNSTFSQELISNLINNKSFNWIVTNYTEGYNKLNNGNYYGLIIIPNNFTNTIESINTTTPSQANIQFLLNSKESTMTGRSVSMGMNQAQSEINNKIVSTVDEAIFSQIVKTSSEALPKINNYENQWFNANHKIDGYENEWYNANKKMALYYQYAQNGYILTENGLNKIKNIADNTPGINPEIYILINNANKTLNSANDNVNYANDKRIFINNQLGLFNDKRNGINDQIRLFNTKDLPTIQKLSQYNLDDVANYFKSPVLISQTDINPLNSYGDSVATFYIPLSLWIGCVVLISMLSIRVKGFKVKSWEEYFGKLGLFQILAMLQSIILTIALLFLNVQNSNPCLLLGSNIFISLCFMTFIYSIVSALGNIGKFLSIIIMVFQISSSGGMYPIQLLPRFFQILNKSLPMTYAIKITKEVIIAPIRDIMIHNGLILLIYPIIGLILALIIKPILYKYVKNMESKMEKTDLF